MGCHFLRQGIFLTQESNLPGRWILYHWATREVQNVLYVVPSFPQTMESSEGCELLQGSHPILGICASQSPAPDLVQGSYLIKVCGLEWMIQKCEQRLECGSLQDVCLLNCCFLMFCISYLPRFFFFSLIEGIHMASLMAQTIKNLPVIWEIWVRSLGREDPLEKGKATHSSILAWRIP